MENLNSQNITGGGLHYYSIPSDFMKVYPCEFIPSIPQIPKITIPFYKKLIEFYQKAKPQLFPEDRDWAGMLIEEILAKIKSAK